MIGLGGLTWKINRRVWLNIIEVEGKKRSGGSGYRWRVGQYFVGGDRLDRRGTLGPSVEPQYTLQIVGHRSNIDQENVLYPWQEGQLQSSLGVGEMPYAVTC